MTEAEVLARHRAVWEARPELRQVYREWFARLLGAVEGLDPVVEVGAGPGFLKEFAPHLVATDVVAGLRVDVRCDADVLPFRRPAWEGSSSWTRSTISLAPWIFSPRLRASSSRADGWP